MKYWKAFLIVSSSFFYFSFTSESQGSLIHDKLKRCNTNDLDSTVLCGKLSVFENRQTNSGRKIDLNIMVIPAVHNNQANAPVFFFDGGPGVAATKNATFFSDSVNLYRLEHDIVLIDVRGTGESNPLHCRQLQFKEGLQQQFVEMYPKQYVKECFDSLSAIADLTQYNTTNMAIDIEEIRIWLGYEKINIFGLSFGGRLAQVYMKMFSASVENCVLWSPTTTYSRMPLYHAKYADASLKKLFDDCKTDSLCNLTFPDLQSEFNELAIRGKKGPFVFENINQQGETLYITIPWHAFHTKIRSLMYMPFGLRQIPYIIHQSYLGNWKPFISLFTGESSYDDFIAEGLYLCVTCTEDVPFISKRDADSLASGTFMGDYRIQQQTDACKLWTRGSVTDNFFDPLKSTIPTLVFSGYFDPVTPPSIAEQIVQGLPNGFHISIRTMSHTSDGLSHPECFDKMVVEFFKNPKIKPNCDCIEQMLPDEFKIKE
ncbi:MAG: alpha/beta fold hydrolase [Bacteroidetes bacterium]|nr:alpha/beta fold hydrolase [Bacteroidota bacterium]